MSKQQTTDIAEDQHICTVDHAKSFDNSLRGMVHPPEKVLGKYIKPGMQIADIGSGLGHFSIGAAEMVGDNGQVYSVDIQQDMLDGLMQRARKRIGATASRIRTILCNRDSLCLPQNLDFVLIFWVIHETPSASGTIKQIYESLKDGGQVYISEPWFHVSRKNFNEILRIGEEIGFKMIERPRLFFGHNVVFQK